MSAMASQITSPLGCLLNRLIRRISKKTSVLCVTGLCAGNSPVTGVLPHRGPLTQKMFPFDDVIMRNRDEWSLAPPIDTQLRISLANMSKRCFTHNSRSPVVWCLLQIGEVWKGREFRCKAPEKDDDTDIYHSGSQSTMVLIMSDR